MPQEIPISFTENFEYAFAVGRIRALETKLLTKQDFSRLIEAKSSEEIIRILSDTDYGPETSEIDDLCDIEDIFRAKTSHLLALVDELTLSPEVTDLLRVRYDFHNLKVLLKAKHADQNFDDLMVHKGTTPVDTLKRSIFNEEYRELPHFLVDAVAKTHVAYEERAEPRAIDISLDREMYAYFLRVLQRAKIPFLLGWIVREIDLLNIRSFFRIREANEEGEILRWSYIADGTLPLSFFTTLLPESAESLPSSFATTDYRAVVEEMTGLGPQRSFATMERLGDEIVIDYLKLARLSPFGLEPVMAYFLIKEHEIRALRVVIIGKLNELPQQNIKERIPREYV